MVALNSSVGRIRRKSIAHQSGASEAEIPGVGASYIRVSDDQQDTQRQYASVAAFEKRFSVRIAPQYRFEDEGWARDEAEKRPAFQRLLKLADQRVIQWIVVDKLDRFGTKNPHQLIHFIYRLQECGCLLYDGAGKEWTGEDIATIITAVVEGEKSKGEQINLSHRSLGQKVGYARDGEWQGGPVRLGFDVACYDRATKKELWRVVYEGVDEAKAEERRQQKAADKTKGDRKRRAYPLKRLQVFPDGRTERFDGEENFPKYQPKTQMLRIAPSRDKAKVHAAVSVFKRYASESISFTALAHHLNSLGFRNSYGGYFQSHHIESMLEDPIYLGYYSYNKRHFGKFNRYADGHLKQEFNYKKKGSKNRKDDWIQSQRLFAPLVEQKTWAAVQRKLEKPKRINAPRRGEAYLAGLVYCGNCGGRMVSGASRKPTKNPRINGSMGERYEYFCGSYFKAVREGRRSECSCLRNGIFQDELEPYIERWLEESGRRLELLTGGVDVDEMTSPLRDRMFNHHEDFCSSMERVLDYICENDPAGWTQMWEPLGQGQDVPVARAVEFYRRCFSPVRFVEQLSELHSQHDSLVERCLRLESKLAIEKVNRQLAELEAKITGLEEKQRNLGDVVEQQWREVAELADSIDKAKEAMSGEANQRIRAEAVQAVIQRIECTFTATGERGGGWGKKNARLVSVTIYPVTGESAEFSVDSKGTLLYSSAHSCI
jgi:DNA invertase Pin-like site-specific DNA recombinase